MQKNKLLIISIIALLSISSVTKAVCPVCTVAVVAGAGFSKMLGIDDTITGLWIGAILISMALWTIEWLNIKKIKFLGRKPLVFLLWTIMFYYSLVWGGLLGSECDKIWGSPKILVGMAIGALVFSLGMICDNILRKINKGDVYMYFQKVIIPTGFLTITSLIFFFLTKC